MENLRKKGSDYQGLETLHPAYVKVLYNLLADKHDYNIFQVRCRISNSKRVYTVLPTNALMITEKNMAYFLQHVLHFDPTAGPKQAANTIIITTAATIISGRLSWRTATLTSF